MAMSPNGTAVTTEPPMAWPVLAIGARAFPIIFNQRAIYLASVLGYDLAQTLNSLRSPEPDPRRYALVMQLLSVCTASAFTSAVPREKPWTAEEWVDFLDAVVPDDQRQDVITKIMQALMVAVVKRASDRTQKTAPHPTTEAPAVPVQ